MPRYFFKFKKGGHEAEPVGADLPDMAAAHVEAARMMGEDLRDYPGSFWDDEEWQIAVSDEHGLVLFTLYSLAIRSSAALGRSGR